MSRIPDQGFGIEGDAGTVIDAETASSTGHACSSWRRSWRRPQQQTTRCERSEPGTSARFCWLSCDRPSALSTAVRDWRSTGGARPQGGDLEDSRRDHPRRGCTRGFWTSPTAIGAYRNLLHLCPAGAGGMDPWRWLGGAGSLRSTCRDGPIPDPPAALLALATRARVVLPRALIQQGLAVDVGCCPRAQCSQSGCGFSEIRMARKQPAPSVAARIRVDAGR